MPYAIKMVIHRRLQSVIKMPDIFLTHHQASLFLMINL